MNENAENRTLPFSEALKCQIEVQNRLQEQLEVCCFAIRNLNGQIIC